MRGSRHFFNVGINTKKIVNTIVNTKKSFTTTIKNKRFYDIVIELSNILLKFKTKETIKIKTKFKIFAYRRLKEFDELKLGDLDIKTIDQMVRKEIT